jgi:quercetin dioxygenase-like cupin family protein
MASTKAQPEFQRDPVKLDSKRYKVELENDQVRVVRVRYSGGEKSVMHQHPPGILISLTDAHFKFTYPDGKSENIQAKAGEHLWFGEVWEHLPENLSGDGFEGLYVELKSPRS